MTARHRRLPRQLRTRSTATNRLEHRFRPTREHVSGIIRQQLGDEAGLDGYLGLRKKDSSLGVARRSKSHDCRGIPQRCREIRHRCDPDPACNEERALDIEVEAISERAKDVDRFAGLERAERTRAGSDRVDQERQPLWRSLAEAHRAWKHASRRLEHEELTGHSGLELSPLEP
jgi:hypothetical protein